MAPTGAGPPSTDHYLESPLMRLPYELRVMIWDLALPRQIISSPIIRALADDEIYYDGANIPPPAVAQICQDSREYACGTGKMWYFFVNIWNQFSHDHMSAREGAGDNAFRPYHWCVWFDPTRDVLWIGHERSQIQDFTRSLRFGQIFPLYLEAEAVIIGERFLLDTLDRFWLGPRVRSIYVDVSESQFAGDLVPEWPAFWHWGDEELTLLPIQDTPIHGKLWIAITRPLLIDEVQTRLRASFVTQRANRYSEHMTDVLRHGVRSGRIAEIQSLYGAPNVHPLGLNVEPSDEGLLDLRQAVQEVNQWVCNGQPIFGQHDKAKENPNVEITIVAPTTWEIWEPFTQYAEGEFDSRSEITSQRDEWE